MGKGSSNETDHLSLGMLGMHGTASANFAISECDLLIAIGARFDDRVTGKLEEFASEAEVVHIDIDPAEISKNRCPQLSFIADTKKFFSHYTKFLRRFLLAENNQTKNWLKRIYKWKKSYQPSSQNFGTNGSKLIAQKLLSFLGNSQKEAIFTTDVGQHQMWSAQLINCQPNHWVSSSGLGTMGFGLPAAIGSKIANPSKIIICITGDSSIQMNIQELATIYQYKLSLFIVIVNNNWQGMVRQWQESFYSNRYSNSYMLLGNPSFSEVAKSYGIYSKKIHKIEELFYFLKEENTKSLSILLDVEVVDVENCYPMVAPGRSNSQMLGLEKIS
jgi:acetolactate synthase-1/2/3 large subunit